MNRGGLIWVYSLSLVGRNTYVKVNKEVMICELSEMMPFNKKSDRLVYFLTNLILFWPLDGIGPIIESAYLHLGAKHHPSDQACEFILWFNIVQYSPGQCPGSSCTIDIIATSTSGQDPTA